MAKESPYVTLKTTFHTTFHPCISFRLSVLALLGLAWLDFAYGLDDVLVLPNVDDLLFITTPPPVLTF